MQPWILMWVLKLLYQDLFVSATKVQRNSEGQLQSSRSLGCGVACYLASVLEARQPHTQAVVELCLRTGNAAERILKQHKTHFVLPGISRFVFML